MQQANERKNGRVIDAPLKIYMETKDHLIEKDNHQPQTSIFGFQPLIFHGVTRPWASTTIEIMVDPISMIKALR